MIASRRDAQRVWPSRQTHVHVWVPVRPGSSQSICTVCWTVTWNQPARG